MEISHRSTIGTSPFWVGSNRTVNFHQAKNITLDLTVYSRSNWKCIFTNQQCGFKQTEHGFYHHPPKDWIQPQQMKICFSKHHLTTEKKMEDPSNVCWAKRAHGSRWFHQGVAQMVTLARASAQAFFQGYHNVYPLVNIQKAIENGHL